MLTEAANAITAQFPPLSSYTCAVKHARTAATLLLFCGFLSLNIAAQTSAEPPTPHRQFEVVAVKQSPPDQSGSSWHGRSDRITIQNYTLRHLIRVAYNLKSDTQVVGGPVWIDKTHFDIAAKFEDADAAALYKLPYDESHPQVLTMLRNFLTDRFQLKVKQDQRMLPIYSLEVAKSGAKIMPLTKPTDSEARNRNHGTDIRNGHLVSNAISMNNFADYLTEFTESSDRVVVNHTGLDGDFDFILDWTRDNGNGIPADAQLPGLFTALQEQLGLTLKSDKAQVPVVVIEAASLPQLD
jgi:uncharacterized protein (TIGR03435 family)